MAESYSVDDHFKGKDPAVREVYDRLIAATKGWGPVKEEAKKTSIHIVNVSALAGVQVRKNYLLLNVKADHKIKSSRIEKTEQISAGRFHHVVKITSPKEIDEELLGWLEAAYVLSG